MEKVIRLLIALLVCGIAASAARAYAADTDWQSVDQIFSRKAAVTYGDVHRYGFPRTDLNVTLDGVTIKPALALGGWVAFKPMHGEVMVMGDLVLLETEINPVMAKMIENGVEITAVHNHLLRRQSGDLLHACRRPRRSGEDGDRHSHRLSRKARRRSTRRRPAAPPPAIDLDTAQLDQIIGVKGRTNGGVYQFGVPRRDPVTMDGMAIAPAGPLGVATGIKLSADRRRQGRDHRRLRDDCRARSIRSSRRLRDGRDRGHGAAQPHARRTAAAVLHAFLGQRRRHQAGKTLRTALDQMANVKNSL